MSVIEFLAPLNAQTTLDHSAYIRNVERAFASFHAAVVDKYGMTEANRAGSDWIEEFRRLCKDRSTDYREVTMAAASRLARRVLSQT